MIKAIQDFKHINNEKILKVNIVEWWLLKYTQDYKETYDFIYSQHLFVLEDGSTVRLPPLGKKTYDEKFLDLYKALDTISELHKNEIYFKQELNEYHKVKKNKSKLKNWLAKNEDYGADKYVCFLIDYLDYDANNNEEHLKVFVHSLDELEILIDRQEFINTIKFLEIFNELYWVQEMLPESLEEIRKSAN